MALMTGEEYLESMRKLNMQIYMFGEKVENFVDNPILRPSLNSVKATYDLAQMPEYEDLMTTTSSLTGKKINRFTHLHQSTDDLIKKVKMQRLCGQKTAACFQRCVGMDAFNATFSTTYEIDEQYGTHYHDNFKKFVEYVQDNDLTVDGAMTDPKGDRSLAPHAQTDPDLYLHVVERRPDGIVVRGAKAHQTGFSNSHEVIVMPTIAMGPDDKDCVTTGELVDMFCNAWGNGLSWENKSDGGPHEANFLKLDCSKLKTTFGWHPRYGVKEAIGLTVEWCQEYEKNGDVVAVMDRQIAEMFQ